MTNIALESHIEKLQEDLEHSHLLSDVLVDMIQEEIARLQEQLDYENNNVLTWDIVNDLENAAAENAVNLTKERIKAKIMDRVTDLKSCGKNDNCWEFGDLIESYIEEWLDEEA